MFYTLHRKQHLENLGNTHPFLFLVLMFVSMPILLLLAVAIITTLVAVPLCFFFDWLGVIDLLH